MIDAEIAPSALNYDFFSKIEILLSIWLWQSRAKIFDKKP